MSFVQAVGRNTIIQFLGKVAGTAFGLVTVGLLQRYLEPSGFGAYTTAMAYLGFFSVLADLGLYLMLIRELTKPNADTGFVVGNLLGLRWVSAAIILGLGALLALLMPYSAAVRSAIWIGSLSFVAIAATQLLVGIFQTRLAMGRVALAELIGRVALLGGIIAVVSLGGSLAQVMLSVVAGSLVNLLIVWFAARGYTRFRPLFNFFYWKTILHDTWPVAISIVLNLIYFRIDTIFLSIFASSYDVGLYGAAYKVLEILNTFPIMFVGLLLPALGAAFAHQHNQDFQRIFQKGFELLVMAALPIVVGGWILAEPILVAIGQQAYAPAAPILRLLLIAVVALFLNSLSGHAVTIINRQRQMVWTYLSVAVIGVTLYLILIPRFSYIGAATGTIITEALTAIVGYVLILRVMHFRLQWRSLPATLVSTIGLGLVAWVLRAQTIWLSLTLSAVTYVSLLIVTRAISFQTIREIIGQRANQPPTLPTA